MYPPLLKSNFYFEHQYIDKDIDILFHCVAYDNQIIILKCLVTLRREDYEELVLSSPNTVLHLAVKISFASLLKRPTYITFLYFQMDLF